NRCNDTVLGALQHQDIPFSTLVSHLKPPRDPSRNPLFQTTFSFQPAGTTNTSLQFPGIHSETLPYESKRSRFDFGITVREQPDGAMELSVEYSTELFGEGRVRRLVAHLGRVLAAAVADPGLPVSRLPLLDE
ncbi:condensation domain-containing protein, partial [Micromonospora tulbaghiae]|uniref:condensation domain-containing protein n=1 Tax=Micromonospora tulbaghiae TaxID=479978 RepID=UPI0029C58842